MRIVLELSTDQDILDTPLDPAWGQPAARYPWDRVDSRQLELPDQAVLVAVAHGNGGEIGNAVPGSIDIDGEAFLELVQCNMQEEAAPAAVYVSTCGRGIAEFAARVRLLAEENDIWHGTRIFGHSDPVAGPVPPPGDIRWFEIL